jgi:mono/diheme cytochrome c family protein
MASPTPPEPPLPPMAPMAPMRQTSPAPSEPPLAAMVSSGLEPAPRGGPGRRSFWVWVLAAVILAEAVVLAVTLVRWRWLSQAEGTPVRRGERLAGRLGCFGCHGPGGAAGIANPGTRSGSVPSWTGGTWMMYSHDEQDVRSWIREGHAPGDTPDPEALLRMPPYRSRISPRDLDDLVAYVLTVQMFGNPTDPKAAEGRDAALRLGCFGCHGPEGRGLTSDPGSLKGYVPPWDGPDYRELVESDEEFRQWVRDGITERFRHNPAARHFLDGEAIKMPAYHDRVKPPELEALLAYVNWVRGHPRR